MDRTIIILLLIALVVIVAAYAVVKQKKKGDNILKTGKGNSLKDKQYDMLVFLQKFFSSVPFINRYYRRVRRKVKILYPADSFSVSKKTSEILMKGVGGAAICIIVTLAFANGDIFFICCGFTITYLIMSAIVNTGINQLNRKLLEQFQIAIDYINTQYQNHHMLPKAIRAAAEDLPQLISLHMQMIYDIITDPKMNEKVDEYVGNEPNRYMLIFLSICASIETYGDKKLKDGSWMFSHDMECLRDGVDSELLTLDKTKEQFMMQEPLAILPIIFIKPIETYMATYFDGTNDYFNGIAGLVSMIVIFITALVSHNIIIMLRDGNEEVDKENDIWSKVASISFIEPYLEKVIDKNYTRYARYDDAQRGIGNRTGPMALLSRQVVFAVGTFVLVIVLFLSSTVKTRFEQAKNWATAFEDSASPSEEYMTNMAEFGSEYYTEIKKEKRNITSEELAKQIKDEKHLDDTTAETIATEVISRTEKYRNAYFKVWYLAIAFALALIAFFSPIWLLKFKRKVSEMRKQEEVIMYQTLMMILMHTSGITLQKILEWMERFAYCFKDSIADCRVSIYSGEEKAIDAMKNREQYIPFQSFCDSLKAIDKVGVEKAFANVQANYSYNVKKRELFITESIEKKSAMSRMVCMATITVEIIFYLVVPMAMYMMTMLSSFNMSIG